MNSLSFILGASVLLMMSSQVTWSVSVGSPPEDTDHEAAVLAKRSSRSLRQLLQPEQKACLWQMDSCNPFEDRCCPGMTCSNIIGGWCFKGIEKCICRPGRYAEGS